MIPTILRKRISTPQAKPASIDEFLSSLATLKDGQAAKLDGTMHLLTYFPASTEFVQDEIVLQNPSAFLHRGAFIVRGTNSARIYVMPLEARFCREADGVYRSQFVQLENSPTNRYELRGSQ